MKPKQDLLSIIVPIHNCSAYLQDCLKSLLKQTYKDIEIIVIDDFSKDNSRKILSSFKKLDKRVRVYRNVKRYGMAISLNRAIKRARGQFITFMDPHDKSLPNRFKKQISYLMEHAKVVSVGSQCVIINKKNKKLEESSFPTNHTQIYETLLGGFSLQFESAVIDRTRVPKDLLYCKPANKNISALLTDLFVKIAQYGELANLGEHLYYRRRLEKAISSRPRKLLERASFVSLWLKSITLSDYKPTFRSLFVPLVKQI